MSELLHVDVDWLVEVRRRLRALAVRDDLSLVIGGDWNSPPMIELRAECSNRTAIIRVTPEVVNDQIDNATELVVRQLAAALWGDL